VCAGIAGGAARTASSSGSGVIVSIGSCLGIGAVPARGRPLRRAGRRKAGSALSRAPWGETVIATPQAAQQSHVIAARGAASCSVAQVAAVARRLNMP
jgi:hypothetical protein